MAYYGESSGGSSGTTTDTTAPFFSQTNVITIGIDPSDA